VHAINGNLQLVGGLSIRLNPVQGVTSIESSGCNKSLNLLQI
jgi:hypothetical protein